MQLGTGTQLTFDKRRSPCLPTPADPEKLLRGVRGKAVECGEACEQATRRAAADGRRHVEPGRRLRTSPSGRRRSSTIWGGRGGLDHCRTIWPTRRWSLAS